MFTIGQRVGILAGLLAKNGPKVYTHGTVIRTVEFWTGITEYVVKADDGTEMVYMPYLLQAV